MKKQSFLLLIAIFLYLFDTMCSEKQSRNCFEILPSEITERIFLFIFTNTDNPLSFAFTVQKVCCAWRKLVLHKEGNIRQFLKKYEIYKKQENENFFANYDAYISGYGDHDNRPDYTFFDSSVFDLTTALKYIILACEHSDFRMIEILIKKDDIILNDFLSDKQCANSMINWHYVCVCRYTFSKCCVRQNREDPYQKTIIQYVISKASSISDKVRLNVFDLFISDDKTSKICMLSKLLPVLNIQKSENSKYYFESILHKVIETEFPFGSEYDVEKLKYFVEDDKRFEKYLLILDTNKANFSLLNAQKDTYNERVANIIYFPSTKIILEDILKKQ